MKNLQYPYNISFLGIPFTTLSLTLLYGDSKNLAFLSTIKATTIIVSDSPKSWIKHGLFGVLLKLELEDEKIHVI